MIVGYGGKNFLLEVKNPKTAYGRAGFNENQKRWNAWWVGPPPVIVYNGEDAKRAIGL